MPKRRLILTGIAASAGFGTAARAQNSLVRIAAASDLKFALPDVLRHFERASGFQASVIYGSSGNLARQLEQGLPVDLFLSADEALVLRLAKSGWAKDEGVIYGRGKLVWLVPKQSGAQLDANLAGMMASLGAAGKLAIANPEHAPYGRAAQAALQSQRLWQAVQSRLVLGESVTQATQFVSTGAAQAGLAALSLALAPELTARTRYVLVSPQLYPPIIQRMALSKTASTAAQAFYAFLQTDAAKAILMTHGLGNLG